MTPVQIRNSLLFAAVTAGLLITGCTSAPVRESIPPFRQGVTTVDQQTSAAFGDVNAFTRRQQIERAINAPSLTEDLFFEALASGDMAKWHRTFALITVYAEKVERLLDPDQRAGIEEELSKLADQMGTVRAEQLPEGVAAAFVKVAGLVVQNKANKDAMQVIRAVDPAIQDVFASMVNAIGTTPETGVRGTVRTAWAQVLGRIDARDFRRTTTEAGKRAAALRYVEALDERDAQDRLLATVGNSISALARSHQEIAHGRRRSASAVLDVLHDEYKAYRKAVEALRDRRQGALAGGQT